MRAAYHGKLEIVQLLLKRAKLDAVTGEGETALHYATRSDSSSLEIVRALVRSGPYSTT